MKRQKKSKDELYQEAVNAYAAWCAMKGYRFVEPDPELSTVGRKWVKLHHQNCLLVQYDHKRRLIVDHLATHCANCGNLLDPDEGHTSKYYFGQLCDRCHELES